MKQRFLLILLAGLFMVPVSANAQLDDALSVLDAQNVNGYMKPLQIALGQAMNSGWYYTAYIRTEGFGARIDILGTDVSLKDEDKTYTAQTPDGFEPPSTAQSSTVAGPGEATFVEGDEGATYVFPGGFDLASVAGGAPQLSFVFIPGTELMARFLTLDLGDSEIGKVDYLGFGVRHNISQYFNNFPVDLAASGTYNQMDVDSDLFSTSTWSLGAQGSKEFNFFTLFGGLQYESYSASCKYTNTLEDEPEDVSVDLDGESAFRATLGGTVMLGVFRVYVAGDFAKRVGLTGGFGFGF